MKITHLMLVSQKEFFDYIEKQINSELASLGYDTDVALEYKIPFTYEKRLKKDDNPDHDGIMETTVTSFDRKGKYCSQFVLDNIRYVVKYSVLHSTKDSIELEYEESYERLSKLPKIIQWILPHKVVKNNKKGMKNTLNQIEKRIVESRAKLWE